MIKTFIFKITLLNSSLLNKTIYNTTFSMFFVILTFKWHMSQMTFQREYKCMICWNFRFTIKILVQHVVYLWTANFINSFTKEETSIFRICLLWSCQISNSKRLVRIKVKFINISLLYAIMENFIKKVSNNNKFKKKIVFNALHFKIF